ncbi:MAG TPA: DUF5677 domain-containing protein, partial [Thermomicrobiales bacterium]|nr:DUF5677 domain-containing protein [Thermomicrobiales bacterium]
SGHPSGANARWRTLHELAVVSYFIKDRGQEVAERYLLHHIVESATSANDYQDYCARLGYEPLSAEEMAALEADKAALCRRFGPEYRHHYGWAAKALGSPRPTFKQIEAAVSLQHWRPYYGMASHSVHAKPKGIAFDLGNMFPSELMLAGPSNSGLADPGQSALISLFQITTILLGLKPDVREIMAMRTIQHFVGEAERAFVEAQRQLDDEERAARELHDSPEMTAEELAALQSRWGEAPHGAPHDENGYAMAHAPADIRRLLAEVMRRRESAGDS